MKMSEQLPTAAARESHARWQAGRDWQEVGEFKIDRYPVGTLERGAYLAVAHEIANENGELL